MSSDYTSLFATPSIKESLDSSNYQYGCTTPDGKYFIIARTEYEIPVDSFNYRTSYYVSEMNLNYNSQTQRGITIPRTPDNIFHTPVISDDGNTFATINLDNQLIIYEWNSLTSEYDLTLTSPIYPGNAFSCVFDHMKIITLQDSSLRIFIGIKSNDPVIEPHAALFFKKDSGSWILDTSLNDSISSPYDTNVSFKVRVGYDTVTDTLRVFNFIDNQAFKIFSIEALTPTGWIDETVDVIKVVFSPDFSLTTWAFSNSRADGKEIVLVRNEFSSNQGIEFYYYDSLSNTWKENTSKYIDFANSILDGPITLSDNGKMLAYNGPNVINLRKWSGTEWTYPLNSQFYLDRKDFFSDLIDGNIIFATGCQNIPLIMYQTTYYDPLPDDNVFTGLYVVSKVPIPLTSPDLTLVYDDINPVPIDVGLTDYDLFSNDILVGANIVSVELTLFLDNNSLYSSLLESSLSVTNDGKLSLIADSGLNLGQYTILYRVETDEGYFSDWGDFYITITDPGIDYNDGIPFAFDGKFLDNEPSFSFISYMQISEVVETLFTNPATEVVVRIDSVLGENVIATLTLSDLQANPLEYISVSSFFGNPETNVPLLFIITGEDTFFISRFDVYSPYDCFFNDISLGEVSSISSRNILENSILVPPYSSTLYEVRIELPDGVNLSSLNNIQVSPTVKSQHIYANADIYRKDINIFLGTIRVDFTVPITISNTLYILDKYIENYYQLLLKNPIEFPLKIPNILSQSELIEAGNNFTLEIDQIDATYNNVSNSIEISTTPDIRPLRIGCILTAGDIISNKFYVNVMVVSELSRVEDIIGLTDILSTEVPKGVNPLSSGPNYFNNENKSDILFKENFGSTTFENLSYLNMLRKIDNFVSVTGKDSGTINLNDTYTLSYVKEEI